MKTNFNRIFNNQNSQIQIRKVSREELMDIFYKAWTSDRYKICKYDNRV